ncbi:hypothetical protein [Burkholderia stagnalis]|uniref:hypothetical protein n=1 Tax=Burkholderia stagnalis TaxID=1503054 RepID=UPI000759EE67|nr:hypothetical protein [Burkholderia stagnalis]KVL90755.1 hypothetical protein WT02_23080 [Burkholderia stagnalis]KVL93745.1 hypothetical protein WT03_14975 [Burkholderia stagnalis]KVM02168.1 hypothetical protein WT04_30735 [Burkholderia stagnalis]
MTKTKKVLCPLLKKPCIEHECAWYAHVVGRDPQTGRDMDHFDCSIRWIPTMITEEARQTRGVQAAVESMRNELVKGQEAMTTAVLTHAIGLPPSRVAIDVTERPAQIGSGVS